MAKQLCGSPEAKTLLAESDTKDVLRYVRMYVLVCVSMLCPGNSDNA